MRSEFSLNPLERLQASEEEYKVIADGVLHVDQGGEFGFQAEVEKNPETPQVTAHRFSKLPFDRQQREVTTTSTERGRDYPTQAGFGGDSKKTTTARVAAREEAASGRHQRGTTSTEYSKQFDLGG